jgi:hypothetical protein
VPLNAPKLPPPTSIPATSVTFGVDSTLQDAAGTLLAIDDSANRAGPYPASDWICATSDGTAPVCGVPSGTCANPPPWDAGANTVSIASTGATVEAVACAPGDAGYVNSQTITVVYPW